MRTLGIICLLLFCFQNPIYALTPDYYVQSLVNQITGDTYRRIMNPSSGTLLYNRTGDTRMLDAATSLPTYDKLAARANVLRLLNSYLLGSKDTAFTTDSFKLNNSKGLCDVVGIKRGSDEAHSGVYILIAHYDSMDRNKTCAPGADDDSSGVTAVLEAARVFGSVSTKATIVFVLADCEELGNKGPFGEYLSYGDDYFIAHFLADASSDSKHIDPARVKAAVCMDMIAYNFPDDRDAVCLFDGGQGLDDFIVELKDAMCKWGGFSRDRVVLAGSNNKSDHYPYFRRRGIPSALVIEKGYLKNPYYHTSKDSVSIPGYIDYAYAAKITRGVVGYVARRADLTYDWIGAFRMENLVTGNPLAPVHNHR